MPAFEALDHVGFAVSDLDRSVEFYSVLLEEPPLLRKVWDVEYVGRVVGYPGLRLEAAFWNLPGEVVLELLQYLDPRPGRVDMETYNAGNAHLCLVTKDLHRDFARLQGVAEFRSSEPVEIPWGPYKGGWAAYLRDPDGITIELIALPPGGVSFDPAEGV
jgi:catechol 2,3-dioxygenase-like lactoylglutathione lyase family enzyme